MHSYQRKNEIAGYYIMVYEDGTYNRMDIKYRINAQPWLAGYAETASGETLAFSILVNNHTAPNSEIRAIIDRIVVTLIQ